MARHEYWELVELLLEQTKDGRLEWIKAAGVSEYQAVFAGHAVGVRQAVTMVRRGYDGEFYDEVDDYSLCVYGPSGEPLDVVGEAEFGDDTDAMHQSLAELYREAQHKAPGLAKALTSILAELRSANGSSTAPLEAGQAH